MAETQKTTDKTDKALTDDALWYVEIPDNVRDSFIKIGNRKLSIIGFGIKRASQFQHHPLNWRQHPPRQQSAVEGSLNTLGWVDFVIENKRSGLVIDGHERIWNALKHDDAYVPFMQVDLSESEEAQALLSLDAMAALAETDQANVDALLEQVTTDDPDLMQFLEDLAAGEDAEHAPGYEQTDQLTPLKMARVLISFSIDQAVFVTDIINELQAIEGVEIDYGAN